MVDESIYYLEGAEDLLKAHHTVSTFTNKDRREAPHYNPATKAKLFSLVLGPNKSLNPGIAMPVAFIRRFLNDKELARCNNYLLDACSPKLKKTAEDGGNVQTISGIYADNSLVFMFVGLRGDSMLSFAEEPRPTKQPSNFLLFKMARKSTELAQKEMEKVGGEVRNGEELSHAQSRNGHHITTIFNVS